MAARVGAILRFMTSDVPERLSFPCDYPIKVMVRVEDGVRSQVDAIVERHAGPIDLAAVTERPSTQGNFLGITYQIRAESPEHIAQLFAALKECPQVMLVL
jgi:putative lipoic acid-binding regulatory protein